MRQTKLIAAKLGVVDVEKWVDSELNGYSGDLDPPSYRTVVSPRLEYHNDSRGGWQFAGHVNVKLRVRQSIAQVENFSSKERVYFPVSKNFQLRDDDGDNFGSDWPQRLMVSGSQYKKIIEAAKNELLQWTIELKKRGIKGEDMDFHEKEKQSATNQVFNIGTVHGAVGNISDSQVTVYDYSSVNQMLIDLKIPKQDRRELQDIMDDLKASAPDRRAALLQRGENWFVKHKEALGAAAEIIRKAIGL